MSVKVVSFVSPTFSNEELRTAENIRHSFEEILSRPADIYFFRPRQANPETSKHIFVYATYRTTPGFKGVREIVPLIKEDGTVAVDGVVSINTVIAHLKNGNVIGEPFQIIS